MIPILFRGLKLSCCRLFALMKPLWNGYLRRTEQKTPMVYFVVEAQHHLGERRIVRSSR